MKILSSAPVVLHSPHPPDVCLELLRREVDTSFWAWRSTKPAAGRISAKSITIRKNIRYRNSFQMVLTASLKPMGSGTEIDGRIGIHPMVKAFMAVWFGGLGIFVMVFLLASSSGLVESGEFGFLPGVVMAAGSAGMMLVGVMVIKFGQYLARNEAAFLTGFLDGLLDARAVVSARPID